MNNGKEILLSIVIPTYNRMNYLKECIDNLIPQIRDNMEVIISDNRSTDETPQLSSEYVEKYEFIHYYRIKDSDLESRTNPMKRYSMVKGKYLFVLCDDDIPLPGCIANILRYIENGKDIALISLNTCSFYKKFTKVYSKGNLNIKEDICTFDKDEFITNVGIWITFISSMVYNWERLKQIKNTEKYNKFGFHINHLALLSTKKRGELVVIKDVCVAGRGGNNSTSYDIFDMFIKNWYILLFSSGIKAGYSYKVLERVYIDSVVTMVKNFIIQAKSGRAKYYLKDKKLFFKYTYKYPEIWLKVYPYVFLPFVK